MSTDAAYHESDWDADKGGESEKEKGGAKQKSSGAKSAILYFLRYELSLKLLSI